VGGVRGHSAPGRGGQAPLALRDQAPHILEAVAKDLTTFQTREAQSEKAKGRVPKREGVPETAVQMHAVLRARGGSVSSQLVAEHRAPRASALRLSIEASPPDQTRVEDISRFNEAIDQAVAEPVGRFHGEIGRARNLLLGMLGPDMRSPSGSAREA
jgi:hypothetical protein